MNTSAIPSTLADALAATSPSALDGLWRALNYLSAAQLYLRSNVLLDRPLETSDVKPQPRGHWGVCPPVNLALSLISPIDRSAPGHVTVLHGAGHASPSVLAYSYLTGRLGERWAALARGPQGIHSLISSFPDDDRQGGEITALIPGQVYMGGQLGPSLSVAAGHVMDRPGQLAIPLIGDGECETGALAASWLAQRCLADGTEHGLILPVILLNGLRMGGQSLLSKLSCSQQDAYFRGLGYRPTRISGEDMTDARDQFVRALRDLRPLGVFDLPAPLVLITAPKGATGPAAVGDRSIIGTPAVHKCPLVSPAHCHEEFEVLKSWLTSYKPAELFTANGQLAPGIEELLPEHTPPVAAPSTIGPPSMRVSFDNFGAAIDTVLSRWAVHPRFRVFSPDELSSNRVSVTATELGGRAPIEVLNEELCHIWLQGYLESGGNGVLISYEAFAAINTSLLAQYLLHRRLAPSSPASLNYVLTSLGWRNTYTHQNPGLVSALIDMGDPTVRIFLPADPLRVAATLDLMLRSRGLMNVLIADKHTEDHYTPTTLDEELESGAAIWNQLSDPERPQLIFAACGDIATRQAVLCRDALRRVLPGIATRHVSISELTAMGHRSERPHALPPAQFEHIFPGSVPVLFLAPGYSGALRNLLWTRPNPSRFTIVGFRHPPRPLSSSALLAHCGFDTESLTNLAMQLIHCTDSGTPKHTTDRFGAAHDHHASSSSGSRTR